MVADWEQDGVCRGSSILRLWGREGFSEAEPASLTGGQQDVLQEL